MGASGPNTPQGKAVARMNATQHGIYSNSPVIPELESEEDWANHRNELIETLAPDGALELMLAERVALLSWRLLRVARYEQGAIATRQEQVVDDVTRHREDERRKLVAHETDRANQVLDELISGRITLASIDAELPEDSIDMPVNTREQEEGFLRRERLLPDEATLNKVMRYESHLNRQFFQALHELEALRTHRTGGAAPLARLEISGPESSPT